MSMRSGRIAITLLSRYFLYTAAATGQECFLLDCGNTIMSLCRRSMSLIREYSGIQVL